VHEAHGEAAPDVAGPDEDVSLGFWESCRRVLLMPTNRRVFAAFTVLGVLLVPFATFLSAFLEQRWGMTAAPRATFFAGYAFAGLVALLAHARRGERLYRASPGRAIRAAGSLLSVAVVLIAAAAAVPVFVIMVACFVLAGAASALVLPLLTVAMLSIVPGDLRPHAQGLIAGLLAAGGLGGSLLLNGVQGQYGLRTAMIVLAVLGLGDAFMLRRAAGLVEADLDRMISDTLEDEELRRIESHGGSLPMLACRGIDFSYGQLQVLFDVEFAVNDGEMVALLGVNGAGKSTLLKVISGIGLPSRGSVRFRGRDITYLDAERRLRIGITQIPGGRAVFAPMTVLENLRSYGYTLGRDKSAVDRAIDNCFEAFPRLGERRNSLAATLSGGEQQMLGLSKALMLRPRLLLIDELSLGLAPVIVAKLLEMVRRINADGTAVVLVEQSVNIALNLVEHAYFMERGAMRFDGRAADLLERDDLLRAVFLQGVGAAL
jgi:ABC-type branched-subunit amino acid transport system ATPase component